MGIVTLMLTSIPAAAQPSPSWVMGVVPLLGIGGFPRPRDIESGATEAGQVLAGAAVELSNHRVLVSAALARGFQPVACAGGCAPEGRIAELAVVVPVVRAFDGRGTLALGPILGQSTFDGRRWMAGAALSAGVTRGLGPRLVIRYGALSGAGAQRSLGGWLGFRLGG